MARTSRQVILGYPHHVWRGMRRRVGVAIIVVMLGVCSAHNLMAGTFTYDSARQLGEAYQMDGVDAAVGGLVRDALIGDIRGSVKEWTIDAIVETGGNDGRFSKGYNRNTPENIARKEAVKKILKEKIKKKLPETARKVLYEKLFLGRFGDEVNEAKKIVDGVIAELDKTLNDRLDETVGSWYDSAISQIDDKMRLDVGPITLDPTNVKKSLGSIISMDALEYGFGAAMSQAIGESTTMALQKNIKEVLNGSLPPAVTDALNRGPEEFAKLASKIEEHLPGKKFDELKNKILHTPLFTIHNGIYGAILSANAAMHFTKAFGFEFNLQEYIRGVEVSNVLIWQLANKESISIDMQMFLDAINLLSDKFGISLDDIGKLGDTIKGAKKHLDDLQGKIDAVDKAIKDNLGKINDEIKSRVADIQNTLKDFQNDLLGPIQDANRDLNKAVKDANKFVQDGIPDSFSGIPANWEDFKKQNHIEELLGKYGDISPWDKIREAARELGFYEARDKFLKDMKDVGEKLNDKISGAAAVVASEAVDAFGFTPQLARALGLQDVPANNPSLDNPLDPVLLHNGEFYYTAIDLAIPGRGFDWSFRRIYRSRADFKGVMGFNWTHNYEERLSLDETKGVHVNEDGNSFIFRKTKNGFKAPAGIFSELREENGLYILREPNGFETVFAPNGLMVYKKDRFGNRMEFEYDRFGRLVKITDTLLREIVYLYGDDGLLTSVKDFSGREITPKYDSSFDLVSVTSPRSFDYSEGKTKRYAYSFGYKDARLNHNMIRVMAPDGEIYLRMSFGDGNFDLDRVVTQQYGSSGEVMKISYRYHLPAFIMKYAGVSHDIVVDTVEVTDRRGITHRYHHNAYGEMLSEALVVDAGEEIKIAVSRYNADGLKIYSRGRNGIAWEGKYKRNNLVRSAVIDRNGKEVSNGEFEYEKEFDQIAQVKNSSGIIYSYEYAPETALLKMSAGGLKKDYKLTYNKYGQITLREDPLKNVFGYEYGEGYLSKDPAGSSYLYDAVGNIVAITTSLGSETHFALNSLNQLITETSATPFNYKTKFLYDANDNIKELIDPNGMKTAYHYNDLDYLVALDRETEKGKEVTSRYERDAEGRILRYIKPEGNPVDYEYDIFGKLVALSDGVDESVKFEYNSYGDLVKKIDANGSETEFEYDATGRVLKSVNAIGTSTLYQYNDVNKLSKINVVDKNGKELSRSEYEYDPFLRLVAAKRLLFRGGDDEKKWLIKKYDYDANDRVVGITTEDGQKWKYGYDKFGNRIEIEGPLGNKVAYTFDADQLLTEVRVEENNGEVVATKYDHDSIGRLASFTDANGGKSLFAYDGLGNVLSRKGPRGFSTLYSYDGLGRRVGIKESISQDLFALTRFEWDGNGRLGKVTDANGNVTAYAYDASDRLIRSIFADGTSDSWKYYHGGLIKDYIKAGGAQLEYKYDTAGNLTEIKSGAEKPHLQQFKYDGLSRMISSFDNNDPKDANDDIEESYVYDSLSRPIAELFGDKWVVRNFNDAGRPELVAYPSQINVFKKYDGLQRLDRAYLDGKRVASSNWSGINRLVGLDFDNEVKESFDRDILSNILEQSLTHEGSLLKKNKYGYLADGFLASEDEEIKYSYDGAGRLVGKTGKTAKDASSWLYDAVGNITIVKTAGEKGTFKYNNVNQCGSYSYDPAGGLTSDGNFNFEYDPFGRLVHARTSDGSTTIKYYYDALGRRVSKKISDAVATNSYEYIYDGYHVAEEYANGALSTSFAYGEKIDTPLGMIHNNERYYFHRNYLGSVFAVSNGAGQISREYSYQPYGKPLTKDLEGDLPHTYAFTSRRFDVETGLYYFRNRYYHPEAGVFLTKDPLGYKMPLYASPYGVPDGSRFTSRNYTGMDARRSFTSAPQLIADASNLISPEMNLYQYAKNNPVNFTDPLGLRIFLEKNGNDISIYITIATSGPYASEALNRTIEDSVESYWKGKHGKYNIQTTASVVTNGGGLGYDRHRFVIDKVGLSSVDCLGCSTSRLYLQENSYMPQYSDVDLRRAIAHETGHFFGADDHYHNDENGTSVADTGWEGNLMACNSGTCHIKEKNIDEIVNAYNNGNMNIGLHRYRPSRYRNRLRAEVNKHGIPTMIDYK